MHRYIVASAIALALLIGGVVLLTSQKVGYVADVTGDIDSLETVLKDAQQLSSTGSLTPEQADAVRARILTKIDAVNASLDSAQKAQLTPVQRNMLGSALSRLQSLLSGYRDTLAVIDANVSEPVKRTLNVRGRTSAERPLVAVAESVSETAADVKEVLQSDEEDASETEGEVADDGSSDAAALETATGDEFASDQQEDGSAEEIDTETPVPSESVDAEESDPETAAENDAEPVTDTENATSSASSSEQIR